MLVLSRKLAERIVIGEGPNQVTVTVTRIAGGKVAIGIEAPWEMPILRGELRAAPGKENAA